MTGSAVEVPRTWQRPERAPINSTPVPAPAVHNNIVRTNIYLNYNTNHRSHYPNLLLLFNSHFSVRVLHMCVTTNRCNTK